MSYLISEITALIHSLFKYITQNLCPSSWQFLLSWNHLKCQESPVLQMLYRCLFQVVLLTHNKKGIIKWYKNAKSYDYKYIVAWTIGAKFSETQSGIFFYVHVILWPQAHTYLYLCACNWSPVSSALAANGQRSWFVQN